MGRKGSENQDTEVLRQAGLRATVPRIRILELLQERGEHHMTVEEIYDDLKRGGYRAGLATIYRVMGQFENAGIVHRHCFDGATSVYELAPDDHHDHMLCEDCGRVVEFNNPEIERLQEEVASSRGFRLVEHTMHLHVRCLDENCEYRRAAGVKGAGTAA